MIPPARYEQVNLDMIEYLSFDVNKDHTKPFRNSQHSIMLALQLIKSFESFATSNEFAIGKHLNKPKSLTLSEVDTQNLLYSTVTRARKVIKQVKFKQI